MNQNQLRRNRRLAITLVVFILFMFALAFIWTRQYTGLGG